MISEVRPIAAGAALRLSLLPPAGAAQWRVLRNGVDAFAGADDPGVVLAYAGSDTSFVDAAPGLVNLAPAFYRAYYWIAGAWVASTTASGTPQATYGDESTDAQSLVRDRLEEGLKVEVARGTFVFEDGRGIPVLTAPPMVDQTVYPVVTVHMEGEDPADRAIGEMIASDSLALDGSWQEHEGWMSSVTLEIAAWCLNPDERIAMRQALRRLVVANLPVFDAAGMVEIAFSQRDAEFLSGEFGAPVFQTVGIFTCRAPVVVTTGFPAIADVDVSVNGEFVNVTN